MPSTQPSAWSVFAADVDGDGDIDVLSASSNDDKIAWYENGGDGIGDVCDNCPEDLNRDQVDADDDGIGDRPAIRAPTRTVTVPEIRGFRWSSCPRDR